MAAAGAAFGRANVAAVYLVHGTFCGNDLLGVLTELARVAPNLSEKLRKLSKGTMDLVLGETGNYTRGVAGRMERDLSAGAGRTMPVVRFNWSSQNTHIARADGAVRLIDELVRCAADISGNQNADLSPRILLWAHSHGGNVLALITNLLGGDLASRREFFDAARPFYRNRANRSAFPAWQRVEEILLAGGNPLGNIALDLVTFGTPIRYGWETAGYTKLLHFDNHRPLSAGGDWLAPYPPPLFRVLTASAGDFVQQIGIAGSGFPPNPIAWRTFAANRRLRRLVARDAPYWLLTNLKAGARVPDEGPTLLVDYADPAHTPLRHLFGHACYTRSRWMPLHCELVAREMYDDFSSG